MRKTVNQACFRIVPLISVLLGLLVIAVKGTNGYGRYEIKGEHMAMQICLSYRLNNFSFFDETKQVRGQAKG